MWCARSPGDNCRQVFVLRNGVLSGHRALGLISRECSTLGRWPSGRVNVVARSDSVYVEVLKAFWVAEDGLKSGEWDRELGIESSFRGPLKLRKADTGIEVAICLFSWIWMWPWSSPYCSFPETHCLSMENETYLLSHRRDWEPCGRWRWGQLKRNLQSYLCLTQDSLSPGFCTSYILKSGKRALELASGKTSSLTLTSLPQHSLLHLQYLSNLIRSFISMSCDHQDPSELSSSRLFPYRWVLSPIFLFSPQLPKHLCCILWNS